MLICAKPPNKHKIGAGQHRHQQILIAPYDSLQDRADISRMENWSDSFSSEETGCVLPIRKLVNTPATAMTTHDKRGPHEIAVQYIRQPRRKRSSDDNGKIGHALQKAVGFGNLVLMNQFRNDAVFARPEKGALGAHQKQNHINPHRKLRSEDNPPEQPSVPVRQSWSPR